MSNARELAEFAAGYGSGSFAVGRNRIINGAMMIDQRNAGAATTISTSAITYSVDRWAGFGVASAGVFTLTRSTTVPAGFNNSLVATCTTADGSIASSDRYFINQAIEGYNFADLNFGTASAKTVALSFWVRSSLTGTYCVTLINSAGNRSYVAEYTVSAADTWEYKTITIAGDTTGTWVTNNGIGVGVRFALAIGSTYQTAANAWAGGNYAATSNQVNWMSSSSSRTFYITGVQLEAGSVATPFEHRQYGQELALCQRYYEKSYSIDVAPGTITNVGTIYSSWNSTGRPYSFSYQFLVLKRNTPTVLIYSTQTGNSGYVANNTGGADVAVSSSAAIGGNTYILSATISQNSQVQWHYTAESEL